MPSYALDAVRRFTGLLATVQRVVAKKAQHSAVGRDIEPASGSRDDVMTFQAFFAAAALAAPAVTPKDIGTQLTPAPS